ncbi:hypothetical protein [Conexibacter sp. CPCC 206217]|uniref:hypothetical protein n=1 Tax=Conexibacter sp. CPCC 206217 TaxID=3064574 RepID=UPI0027172A94|nr:hypothetical protein [Conexibacter sp. CPCC 206217]MDO8210007.1 hypothetical protein [Conexibacter sp. CPCC 206217]
MARRAALLAGLLGLVLIAVLLLLPFATEDRQLYGTFPQPDAVAAVTLVGLRGGQRACLDEAVVDPHSEVAQLRVGTYGRPAQPLRLTLTGDGYRQTVAIPASGYGDNELLAIPVTPPAAPVEVVICLANEGSRRVALYGTADRAKTRSTTRIDGVRQAANPAIRFAEARPASLADRVSTLADRIEVFRPSLLSGWMLWLLLALVVVGVPAGAVLALDRALRDDEG